MAIHINTTHLARGHILDKSFRFRVNSFVVLRDQASGDHTSISVTLHVESGELFLPGSFVNRSEFHDLLNGLKRSTYVS